ncbi:hypothetical protein BS17DRAFT_601983 [Gyrodon lividus]|nr:hypothetical protein BS17DRAFT_601983 [Gyrodon lividus]
MLQRRATSSLPPSCFRQWKTVRYISEARHSSLTASPESDSPRSATTHRLASLDDILTQVTTGSSTRTRMATSLPDSEKQSTQRPQTSRRPLSLLTRLSTRTTTGLLDDRAPDGTQRTQGTPAAVESAADDKRSVSAVSLVSRQTTQTGNLTTDRRHSKPNSSKHGAARKLLEQPTNIKTEAVNTEGLSEESTTEDAIKEESGRKGRAEHPRASLTVPRTNLVELFASSGAGPSTQAALRLQFTRERGGDYSNYLPPESAALGSKLSSTDYAQLALGRNKQIPLRLQVGALDVIKQSIRGQVTKTV